MIPTEAYIGVKEGRRITIVPHRTQYEREGYEYVPSGYTYRVPQETGTYVKYERPQTWEEATVAGQIYAGKRIRKHDGGPRWHTFAYEELSPEAKQRIMPIMVPIREFGAGVIGIPEATLKGIVNIGSMVMGQPPAYVSPPTPAGALIGLPLGRAEEFELYRKGELSPFYLVGGITGTILETATISYGISKGAEVAKKIPTVAKVSSKVSIAWQRHVTEPVMKRMPTFVQKVYYGQEYYARIAERQLVWEKPPFIGYKEFYAQIETPLLTRPSPEKWYITFKGKTTTPMTYTLERAITKGKPLGGLAATQQIVVTDVKKRAIWQPRRLFTEGLTIGTKEGLKAPFTAIALSSLFKVSLKPTARVRTIKTGKIVARIRRPQIPRMKHVLRSKQILGVQQAQILRTQQVTKQLQKQTQITLQTTLRPPQIARQTFKMPYFEFPKAKGRRVKGKRYGEEWFFKKHKLATLKEVAKDVLG